MQTGTEMEGMDMSASESALQDEDKKFGWMRIAREEKLEELKKAGSDKTGPAIEYQGKVMHLPLLSVPIGLPKYRLQNGRTSSAQKEWLATHKDKQADMFEADPELREAQIEQHRLLLGLKTKDLEDKFKNPAQQQTEPIILDSDGFVINGNTRLAYWRSLHYGAPETFKQYAYIDAIVLPKGDDKDIDRLEAKLQLERDIRANYTWHAEAKMVKTRLKHGLQETEIASIFGWKDSEVPRRVEMWDLGDEYLRTRGREDMWSTIDSYDYAFGTLVDTMAKITGVDNKTLFKEMAFLLIDNRDKVGSSGSVHDAIKNLKEHFDKVKSNLGKQFKPADAAAEVPAVEEAKQDELFGPSTKKAAADDEQTKKEGLVNAIPLATEISKEANSAAAVETIVETIDSERQKEKDVKNANYLMSCCTKAYGLLQGAVQSGLTPDAKLTGVDAQLKQIEALVETIRKHLDSHAAD
jgi:hypothetical protein